MSLHSSQCREIRPYFESGHLGVHSILASKVRVPSHTYSREKPPLEVLVENWHSSLVEARESALMLR